MKSIQYYGPENIKYEEVTVNPPKEGEVVVKIMAALTCGTDVKTYRRGHPVLIKKIPSGFGHEFAGIVDQVGAGVENVKTLDKHHIRSTEVALHQIVGNYVVTEFDALQFILTRVI